MQDYFTCTKESLKLESPFRLLIIGPMHSGSLFKLIVYKLVNI